MMYQNLALLAAFVFVYSIVGGGLAKTPVNGAIVFAAFGLAMGPEGLGLLDLNVDTEGLRALAELTLALVLFTDAASADLSVLRKSIAIPRRLLLIGLPLTILLGMGAAILVFDGLSVFEVAILATLLAPTDAALGKAVVTDPAVPVNIRESLNVESGLNDGICVPILFVFLALATEQAVGGDTATLALGLVAEEIGIGAVVGLGLTLAGTRLLGACARRGWVAESWLQLPVTAMAMTCFSVAQVLGGSGFIAAFAGGLLFGFLVKNHRAKLLLAAEATGDIFALVTWVIFGAGVAGYAFEHLTWQIGLYAVLSLTVIRMLPVYLVLGGMGLRSDEKLFMGWFGPRGLASIVFAVIVLNRQLPGGSVIVPTAAWTIVLSVLAHGLSANPLVRVISTKANERVRE